jgi:hypothetical protein
MTQKPEGKLMPDDSSLTEIEKQKIELVKMRIKNDYYKREDILNQVVAEILNKELRNKT